MVTIQSLIEALQKFPAGAIVYVDFDRAIGNEATIQSIKAEYDLPEKITEVRLIVY